MKDISTEPKTNKNNTTEHDEWHRAKKPATNSANTLRVLNSVYQNALMAKESICTTLPNAKNEKFAELLKSQIKDYQDFMDKAHKMAEKMDVDIDGDNSITKFFIKTNIKMKMLTDSSTSHIAEMMLIGTTMGIVELGKLIRHTPDVLDGAMELLRELLIFEEDKVELMKYYL